MSNQYAALMRKGAKLPPEAKDETGRLAAFHPTDDERDFVETLASNGVAEAVIAKLLKISRETLRKRFKTEIGDGRDQVTARMGAALVREGIAGNVAAIRFWLLARGGPEWAMARETIRGLETFTESRETVHFYMPSNGRDQPEALDPEPPTIDGQVSEAA